MLGSAVRARPLLPNFTTEQVTKISTEYNAVRGQTYEQRDAVLKRLATELDVTKPQVRGVLVSRNEYISKPKTKGPDGRTTKGEYVKAFEDVTGKKLPSFAKASLKDLQEFWDWLVEASAQREVD